MFRSSLREAVAGKGPRNLYAPGRANARVAEDHRRSSLVEEIREAVEDMVSG